MKVEVLFNYKYKDNDRYSQRKYNKSHFGQYNLCSFHTYKSVQITRETSVVYNRFEFILNKCIYIKLL